MKLTIIILVLLSIILLGFNSTEIPMSCDKKVSKAIFCNSNDSIVLRISILSSTGKNVVSSKNIVRIKIPRMFLDSDSIIVFDTKKDISVESTIHNEWNLKGTKTSFNGKIKKTKKHILISYRNKDFFKMEKLIKFSLREIKKVCSEEG